MAIDLRVVSYLMPLSSSTQGKTDVEPPRVVGQQLTPSQVLLQNEVTASNPAGGYDSRRKLNKQSSSFSLVMLRAISSSKPIVSSSNVLSAPLPSSITSDD